MFTQNRKIRGSLRPNQQLNNHEKENKNNSPFMYSPSGRRGRGGNSFHQNIFQHEHQDKQDVPKKITAEDRAQRFGSTSKSAIYDKLKKNRVIERKQAIVNGLIPDPNAPTRLEEAIDFRGTCQEKCPQFEMIEREIQNGLDGLEMDPQGNVDPQKAVKAYRRSAAGNEQPLPSDVRSPKALVSTLDYLIDDVLSNNTLDKCHAFIRDRTRSIRQDFTLQNIRDITAVQVHERIARFHILCLHEMCEFDESKFSEQQETEQLRKVLLSLMEFYDDLREEGIETENEAEFRAYYMISHIRDQDVARQAQTLPINVFKHPYMMRALEFHALTQRNNEIMETSSRRNKPTNSEASQNFYSAFFKLIADPNTSFLMACMLECHFADIRKGALKAMNVSYMMKAGGVEAEYVQYILAYDTLNQLLQEANLYGLAIDMSLGEPTIRFGQKHYRAKLPIFIEPLSNPSQKKSLLLVEPKKSGLTFRDVINGSHPPNRPPTESAFSKLSRPANKANHAPVFNIKLSELMEEDPAVIQQQQEDERVKQEKLDAIRAQAAIATAAATAERKKLEDLIAKKEMEKARYEQEQRVKEEKERQEEQRLYQERERMTRELKEQRERKAREQAEMARKEQLLFQEREKKVADMRRQALKSQLCNRFINQLLEEVLMEKVHESAEKLNKTRNYIIHKSNPIIQRVRERIVERDTKALERHRIWNMNMCMIINNPYSSLKRLQKARPLHSTPEGIHKRVQQSILAERYALEDIKKPLEDNQSSIWKTENFSQNIYPRINDKMAELKLKNPTSEKPNWQLLVSVANSQLDSSVWFKEKFGLDDTFNRRVDRYEAFVITIRMITTETHLPSKWVDETGAVIFSLPESNIQYTPEDEALYWCENKNRLYKLTQDIRKFNPEAKIPILFTCFPGSESMLSKIPLHLGLDSNQSISDYHILIMNPLTVAERIVDEVNWLSTGFVIV